MESSWAVYVVANHTRREILAAAAEVNVEHAGNLAGLATIAESYAEQQVAGCALVTHWSFAEDRMRVVATIRVGDGLAAIDLAGDLRRHFRALCHHCPRAWQFVADGYQVLGNADSTEAAICRGR
ncbi:MAG: hypothetical protein JW751_00970 [Polyangiaceae bacterium]|nr:hypothetical protein [Polyangiaceae bacterium]